MGGQRHVPAALSPGKTRHPMHRRLGGTQERSGRVQKISPLTGIRSPDHPARSESLYRLNYRGTRAVMYKVEFDIRTYINRNLCIVTRFSTLWNFQVWSSNGMVWNDDEHGMNSVDLNCFRTRLQRCKVFENDPRPFPIYLSWIHDTVTVLECKVSE